jgi:hypothetical protein
LEIRMNRFLTTALLRRAAPSLIVCFAAPALADHTGPTGVGGSGGWIDVQGPETLQAGHVAIGQQTTLSLPQDRSDAELEALAAQHIHAHNSDYTLNAAIGAAYGVTDRLTLSAQAPYIRRDGLREGEHSHSGGVTTNNVVRLGSVTGFGDASILAKYRVTAGAGPGLALIGGIKLPTGGTHAHALSGERLETEHQTGTGSWDPILGAAFGAELGWATLGASALYQFAGKGAQETRLGDRLQAGLALSHRFGPAEHHHDEDQGASRHEHHEHQQASCDGFTSATVQREGRQTIAGAVEKESGGTTVWLTPGLRYNSASEFSLAAALGVPLWQDVRASHPDNRLRLIVSLGKAF